MVFGYLMKWSFASFCSAVPKAQGHLQRDTLRVAFKSWNIFLVNRWFASMCIAHPRLSLVWYPWYKKDSKCDFIFTDFLRALLFKVLRFYPHLSFRLYFKCSHVSWKWKYCSMIINYLRQVIDRCFITLNNFSRFKG